MSNINGFAIENGVLIKYNGSDKDVVIPDSVTNIGYYAFISCWGLKSITIPDSVTSIDEGAFSNCYNLESIIIPDSVTNIGKSTFCDCWNLRSITIPNSVTSIGHNAFSGCRSLENIIIPDSVTSIGDGVLSGCSSLKSITIPTTFNISKDFFGYSFLPGLYDQVEFLLPRFTDSAIKQYLLVEEVWEKLSVFVQTEIFFTKQSKSLKVAYDKLINKNTAEEIAKAMFEKLPAEASVKECNAVALCMDILVSKASVGSIRKMYDWLCSQKKGKKAVVTISENKKFTDVLSIENKVNENLPEAEKLVMNKLQNSKMTKEELADMFKEYYSLTKKDIPQVYYKTGEKVSEIVLMWLLTIHEVFYDDLCGEDEDYYENPDEDYIDYYKIWDYFAGDTLTTAHDIFGACEEAQEILYYIDEESFQSCLLQLADKNLGLKGSSKKRYLAFPICRYANEELMAELTKRAPQWRSSSMRNYAPPLRTFRVAVMYSETRASVLFADKFDDLDFYAKIRNTTTDCIRDMFLSDIGVDANGCKEYDLGNQKVVAKLQSDLSFIVVLENGKTAKSLPKKGADEKLYEVAKADFDAMKKDSKKIVKNRKETLFEDFLSGRARTSEEWQKSYLDNILLRMVASLLVWAQGNKTFTLKDGTPVTADGSDYVISDAEIKVAHPMEMKTDDVFAWQQYFVKNAIKQPFEQIWEPVINGEQVKSDRYKGAKIPYYRFTGKAKHGIVVQDYDFHNEIDITLKDCVVRIIRHDWQRHQINVNDSFEIEWFGFKEYTRQVNHLVAYFDKCTVYDRIAKDDVTIEIFLPQFTLAQITEFIRVASENNATNVQALLLEYKNKNFSDFDPMEEFTLD